MPIPFEPQQTIDGSRTCGAAALAMVYRSLGLPSEQLDVWHRVAEDVRSGAKAARTHRLALDACRQGLAAVTLQATRPPELLARLLGNDARVILNHRLDRQSQLGHYSVLLGFDGDKIAIHDPHHGPGRVLPWSEFASLWGPGKGPSEIVGWVLVAIGLTSGDNRLCAVCGKPLPVHWICPRCRQPASLGPPGAVESCVPACNDPLCARLFCPHCDWAVANHGKIDPRECRGS